ncbi:hypothetical protein ACA910_008697 [Epithemia clementina (nom. ined.)]
MPHLIHPYAPSKRHHGADLRPSAREFTRARWATPQDDCSIEYDTGQPLLSDEAHACRSSDTTDFSVEYDSGRVLSKQYSPATPSRARQWTSTYDGITFPTSWEKGQHHWPHLFVVVRRRSHPIEKDGDGLFRGDIPA